MDVADYIAHLDRDGALLADAAASAGLTAAVAPCPGWQVRDLLRHVSYVHSWAARHVREQCAELIDGATEEEILHGGPPDGELIATYRAGHAALVGALRAADPDVRCATFMAAPSPLAFWARRQAHETAIHRFDAQAAIPGGAVSPAAAFDPVFADDGVDELITGFGARRRYRLRGGGEQSMAVQASDTGGRWLVRLSDGVTEVSRGDGPAGAACVLDGTAAGLYAFLWNRCDSTAAAVTASGDPGILDTWLSSVRVRWA